MYKYVLKRLLMLIPVLLGVTFIVFFILNLSPGDPAAMILGDQASAEALEMKREELGLNDPLLVRYGNYIWDMLHGDLGVSYKNNLSVWDQVIERFPNTTILAIAGILVALVIGIPTGIISAKKQYTAIDNCSMVLALIGVAMPNFWFGLLMVIIFSLTLGWLPSQGMGAGGVDTGNRFRSDDHTYDAFLYVGSNPSGLHQYCKSKRCIRKENYIPPYAQKCNDSNCHSCRTSVRNTARWSNADRDRIFMAGSWKINGRFN